MMIPHTEPESRNILLSAIETVKLKSVLQSMLKKKIVFSCSVTMLTFLNPF